MYLSIYSCQLAVRSSSINVNDNGFRQTLAEGDFVFIIKDLLWFDKCRRGYKVIQGNFP